MFVTYSVKSNFLYNNSFKKMYKIFVQCRDDKNDRQKEVGNKIGGLNTILFIIPIHQCSGQNCLLAEAKHTILF